MKYTLVTQTTREKDYYFDISQEEHNVCDNAYNDLTIVPLLYHWGAA